MTSWQKITQYNAAIERMHDRGDHSRCTAEDCYEVEGAEKAHAEETHDWAACMPSTCKVVAVSHNTDHKMCSPENCKIVDQKHSKEDHSICSGYACSAKDAMDIAHNFKVHCLDCSPYICEDAAKSHATDHALCNSRWCEKVATKHNNDDHSACHESWCLAKQAALHESNNHEFCRSYDCNVVANKEHLLKSLLDLDAEE